MVLDTQPNPAAPGPDFICFGLPKAGTQWLYDQLRHSDEFWMPPIKELSYFLGRSFKSSNLRTLKEYQQFGSTDGNARHKDRDEAFMAAYSARSGGDRADNDWYLSLFAEKGHLLSGDITPTYSRMDKRDIRRIKRLLPAIRAVFLIRHPVDRYLSHLSMNVEAGSFPEEALQSEAKVFEHLNSKTMLRKSFPSIVWGRWRSVFDEQQMQFWFLEDISHRPETVVREIAQFVGATSFRSDLNPGYNRKQTARRISLPDPILDKVYDYFAEEIDYCGRVFGSHAENWNRSRLG